MKLFLFVIIITLPLLLSGQGHENNLVFGYAGGSASPNDPTFGLNVLTFSNGSLHLSDNQDSECFFNDTDAAISDGNGKLLFYFNGMDIYNNLHQIMDGGNALNDSKPTGYDLPQGGIIIPFPEQAQKYLLLYGEEGYVAPWGNACTGLYYALIDMSYNNGLGKVVRRKMPLVVDTLEYGKLAVVRHANGRDWWLVTGESWQNTFYRFLIDPQGVHYKGKQTVGTPRIYGIGQAAFSPDGTKYAMYGSMGAGIYTRYLDIYDFDRCSGLFSNHEHFEITINSIAGGITFSPSSQWLYLSLNNGLYKFDLTSSPIQPTQQLVAEYEPFNDPFPTKFLWSFLAPDNKIYIVTTSGSSTLHVIHKPDEPGLDCAFEQHGIRLPCKNNSSLPTFANYRLGPLDGSACDTLDIDNDPVSWWRYSQDTLSPQSVEFADLSYHEPDTWSWDFGDGSAGSTQRHPVHYFNSPGIYQVCLTVSNINGSDTHCKTLYLGVSAQSNPVLQSQIAITPNPFRGRLSVALSTNLRSPEFSLYDQAGRLVLKEQLAYGVTMLDTWSLTGGMYFWEVRSDGRTVKVGKLVKVLE